MVGPIGHRVLLKALAAPGARCAREARRRAGVGVNGRHYPPTQPAAARDALSYGVDGAHRPGRALYIGIGRVHATSIRKAVGLRLVVLKRRLIRLGGIAASFQPHPTTSRLVQVLIGQASESIISSCFPVTSSVLEKTSSRSLRSDMVTPRFVDNQPSGRNREGRQSPVPARGSASLWDIATAR